MTRLYKHIQRDRKSDILNAYNKRVRQVKNDLLVDLKAFQIYTFLDNKTNKILNVLDTMTEILKEKEEIKNDSFIKGTIQRREIQQIDLNSSVSLNTQEVEK
jgi:hypothetical protein